MQRFRRLPTLGLVAAFALFVILFTCFVTVPFTFGKASIGPDANIVRYNAGSPVLARLPPRVIAANPIETDRSSMFDVLGTDELGRSLLWRLLAGGAVSLTIGLLATALALTIGTLYGLFSGFMGGRVDALMMRILDVLFSLPYVLLVVLLAVSADAIREEYVVRNGDRETFVSTMARDALGQSIDRTQIEAWKGTPDGLAARDLALAEYPPREISQRGRVVIDLATLLFAIGGASWLSMARVVRGQVLSLRSRPFFEGARALGASPARLMLRHLLPNLTGPILIYATLTVPQAILQESFLSFLGIGVKPPVPSWGSLASRGLEEVNPYRSHWWLLLLPCGLLAVTLVSLNFLGEAIRRELDPLMKKTR